MDIQTQVIMVAVVGTALYIYIYPKDAETRLNDFWDWSGQWIEDLGKEPRITLNKT
jgi:hypothetical protein